MSKTQTGIPFSLTDYLQLVDWTGRVIRDDKRGAILDHLPTIVQRLAIDQTLWFSSAAQFEAVHRQRFGTVAGAGPCVVPARAGLQG